MSTVHAFPDRWQIDVAANVRAEAARKQLRQGQISDALGENQQWVSRRMTGAVPWSVVELVAVADVLGIHPAVLMGGRPPLSGDTPPRVGDNGQYVASDHMATVLQMPAPRTQSVTRDSATRVKIIHLPVAR